MNQALSRRQAAAALVTIALSSTKTTAQVNTIKLLMVSPLTGPAASIGVPLMQATQAYFNRFNDSGGLSDKRVQLVVRDDGFKPERTLEEVRAGAQDQAVVALMNVVGAPNNGDLLTRGALSEHGLCVVGAFTGATSVRALRSPNMYFVRASVAHEAQRMAQQLATMGIGKIAIFHANDAFGRDARSHVEAALAANSMRLAGAQSYEPATVAVLPAATALKEIGAQAILMFGTGPASAKFVGEYRKIGGGGILIANSSTSPDVLVKEIGADLSRGIGLAQVVPSITRTTIGVVRDYVETLTRYGDSGWEPSSYGLEGFMAARLMAEALRRVGGLANRRSVMAALASLGRVDLGGFVLDYSGGSREGSRWVDIGIIGPSGKLMN